LALVDAWVKLNWDALQAQWDGRIDSAETIRRLKKVGDA
jgi:hypothetical protein